MSYFRDLAATPRSYPLLAACVIGVMATLTVGTCWASGGTRRQGQTTVAPVAAKKASMRRSSASRSSRMPNKPKTTKDHPVATLAALLARFRASPGLKARFTESKRMALLATPLVSSGRLYFRRPGELARHIDRPSRSALFVTPQRVTIYDGIGHKQIDLDRKPIVRRFVDSFVVLLRGDMKALKARFATRFERLAPQSATAKPPKPSAPPMTSHRAKNVDKGPRWRLVLLPRQAPLNKVFRRMIVTGRGINVQRLRMEEVDGDVAVTTFSHVQPRHHFTKAEAARVFRPVQAK